MKKPKTDNLSKAQDLHNAYMNEIEIWHYRYMSFSGKLDPMTIKIMSKNLDAYKKMDKILNTIL